MEDGAQLQPEDTLRTYTLDEIRLLAWLYTDDQLSLMGVSRQSIDLAFRSSRRPHPNPEAALLFLRAQDPVADALRGAMQDPVLVALVVALTTPIEEIGHLFADRGKKLIDQNVRYVWQLANQDPDLAQLLLLYDGETENFVRWFREHVPEDDSRNTAALALAKLVTGGA